MELCAALSRVALPALLLWLAPILSAAPLDGIVQSDVFVSGQDGYHTYRIPSLIVSSEGTLLAFSEGRKRGTSDTGNIDLVLKRSFDQGKTWLKMQIVWDDDSNTCGNACPVVDRATGTIWLLLTHNLGVDREAQIVDGTSKGSRTVWISKSTDDGASWSKPVEITKDVKLANWTWYATGPGIGIQLKSGRLVIPCDNKVAGTQARQSHIIYSDDHGSTWKLGGVVGPNCNESQVVELADGSLLLNMRSYMANNRRLISTSRDGGLTWSNPSEDATLIEPVCQASILRYDSGEKGKAPVLLFSNPASTKREKMTVRLSYDQGETWPAAKQLHGGLSAYSCLTVLPDQNIGCLYERGEKSAYEKITLEVFSLNWLTNGSKRPDSRAGQIGFPPALPEGRAVATDKSDVFLKPPKTLKSDVAIAKTTPTIDFLFYPGQNYPGKPWSAWGDSLAVNGKYYASIGDHLAPGGNAFVFEYDPATKAFRQLVDLKKFLGLPERNYAPGKIHSRLDLGSDGWLYFATHRGSPKATTDEFDYAGDWVIRLHPVQERTEIVVHAPVAKHAIPASVLDPVRLIFYGGTAPGADAKDQGQRFFAFDIRARKLLYAGPDGPSRYLILAKSTGRVYFTPGGDDGQLMRFDPTKGGAPERIDATIGLRAATEETKEGVVYTVSSGQGSAQAILYAFDTKTEKVTTLGAAAVGSQNYITSLDVDPSGKFLYYVPGAHGGSESDGSTVVQFDLNTKQKKVIAFLHPYYAEKYGFTLKGTFSSAIDPAGDKLYITWNNSRGARAWDSCVLTVIHIPEVER